VTSDRISLDAFSGEVKRGGRSREVSPGAAFSLALPLARLIRPWIERAASRLWIDDGRYAERLHELRAR